MVCVIKTDNCKDNSNKTNRLTKVKKPKSQELSSCIMKEKKKFLVEQEFSALRALLPSASSSDFDHSSSSPLDVVLEAISYIEQLEQQLVKRSPEFLSWRQDKAC